MDEQSRRGLKTRDNRIAGQFSGIQHMIGHSTGIEHADARPMPQEQLLGEMRAVLTNFLK